MDAALRRNARIYLTGLAFSLVGDSALILVAGIWVKALTGDSSAAALVSVCIYAPSLLGPLAGAVVDRRPSRGTLVAINLAAAALVLPLLLVRTESDIWLIYAVMAAYGLAAVVIDPAETALFTATFPAEVRPQLNGLRLTLQEGGKLVAPLAGAGLYAACGGGAVAALDAVSFLVAALAVRLLRIRGAPAPVREPVSWWRDVTAGGRALATERRLRQVVLPVAGAMAVSGVLVAAQFDLVAALHRPPSFLGVLTGVLGAGSILAGLVSGRVIARLGEAGVVGVALVAAALGSALRAAAQIAPAVAGSFVLGFALPWMVVAAMTITQRLTPPHRQGRVAAALTFALFAPQPVMQALGAALIRVVDFRLLYAGAALLQLGLALLLLRRRAVAAEERPLLLEQPDQHERPRCPPLAAGGDASGAGAGQQR